jgi:hypothetical protein
MSLSENPDPTKTKISKQGTKARKSLLPCALFLLLLLPGLCLAYGYSREEDPLIKSFKNVVKAARKADWSAVSKENKAVNWQLDELKGDLKIDFAPILKSSLDKKDKRLIIIRWANLIYLALKQKFYWNKKETLKDFQKAKGRLASARFYYDVALAGNVKRFDQKRKTTLHKDILTLFNQLRTQLGRPAVLGTSSVAADAEGFQKSSKALVSKLDRVFPYFQRKTKTKKAEDKQ